MNQEWIQIFGAHQHNLKHLNVRIPKNKLTVITGLSGAGKSSLAFDTLYAEGRRRYMETLSPAVRRYMHQFARPQVDSIEGLSPTVAIRQTRNSPNPRSTVGSSSEILHYLRLLFAHAGQAYCSRCNQALHAYTRQEITAFTLQHPKPARLLVCAPRHPSHQGDASQQARIFFQQEWAQLRREGFVRARVNGEMALLEEAPPEPIDSLELVVDRLVLGKARQSEESTLHKRLAEAIELALLKGDGSVLMVWLPAANLVQAKAEIQMFSALPRCWTCGVHYPSPKTQRFSFNHPLGACPKCQGLGATLHGEEALIVPNADLNLAEGALAPWRGAGEAGAQALLSKLSQKLGFSVFTPFKQLTAAQQKALLYGMHPSTPLPKQPSKPHAANAKRKTTKQAQKPSTKTASPTAQNPPPKAISPSKEEVFEVFEAFEAFEAFEGIIPNLERRYRETRAERSREILGRFLRPHPCSLCGGEGLGELGRFTRLNQHNIAQVCQLPLGDVQNWLNALTLPTALAHAIEDALLRVKNRLNALVEVGLAHLQLQRPLSTLSSGELRRIQLTTQLGSHLSGVIHVLDEPTAGLHPSEIAQLLDVLECLRAEGNTVVVVEHDLQVIERAEYLIEIGPKAGEAGGYLLHQGLPTELLGKDTPTAQALRQNMKRANAQEFVWERPIPPLGHKRPCLHVQGAYAHHLKQLSLRIPLGALVVFCGVSGSGKSSLLLDVLLPALKRCFNAEPLDQLPLAALTGWEGLRKVVPINQQPLGRSSRSTPGGRLGTLGQIRSLFAATPAAKRRGYQASRFSFNVNGGRCEACQGEGVRRLDMQFLPDAQAVCEICEGSRFNHETLQVRYRGKSIADVLKMDMAEAATLFQAIPPIHQRFTEACVAGIGHLKLGQSANTLSGGEAQRIKLLSALHSQDAKTTLFILDEPTTGLHHQDVQNLLRTLRKLVQNGASVLVIEHQLDILRGADYVVELGPASGPAGGELLFAGHPSLLTQTEHALHSNTAPYLALLEAQKNPL